MNTSLNSALNISLSSLAMLSLQLLVRTDILSNSVFLAILGFFNLWIGFSGKTIKYWVKKRITKLLFDMLS